MKIIDVVFVLLVGLQGSFQGQGQGQGQGQENGHFENDNNGYNLTHFTTKSRVVETKYGKLQGLAITLFPHQLGRPNPLKNKVVEVFMNIPYASQPYRFSPTSSPIPWDGIRSSIKPGYVCPQMMPDIRNESEALKNMPKGYYEYLRRVEPFLRNQSEDCLYLNIYSPRGPDPRLKPVLVYIHGGKFAWGSGILMDGTVLSAYADVLVITINYRLGVLGFLNANLSPSTKPRVANFGLMDQVAALHWIKENVYSFGGDPENITLMGYEAGAACIHFLMSSPAVMPGLFHRSILIAGSSLAPWALIPDPAAVAVSLAESLNCSQSINSTGFPNSTTSQGQGHQGQGQGSQNPEKGHGSHYGSGKSAQAPEPLLECLMTKHFSYFSKFIPPKFSVDFGPSIDGIVIKSNFRATSESQMGKRDLDLSKKYDLLFGLSSLEKITSFSEADLKLGFETGRRDAILRTLIRNSYRYHLNEILATITNEYIDWERSVQHPISTRDLTIQAVTDCLALAPVIGVSQSPQAKRTFFYVFDHSTKDGPYNYQQLSGSGGGEELNYMFGVSLVESIVGRPLPFAPAVFPANFSKTDMALAELIITYLSNFIHNGDPNEPSKFESVWPISKERNRFKNTAWEAYEKLHQKYLEISGNKLRIRTHFRAHQMAIWLRLVPELQRSGIHYVALYSPHNRMKGGNDPQLYSGSLRLPHEEDGGFYGGSSGGVAGPGLEESDEGGGEDPPAPPTTCFSPLMEESSVQGGANARSRRGNETVEHQFSPYSTALSVTIAIGCSLLILNVFIFALVYYQRDKKRAQKGSQNQQNQQNSQQQQQLNQQHQLNQMKYGGENPPELLKSSNSNSQLQQQTQLQLAQEALESMQMYHQQQIQQQQQQQNKQQQHRGILLSPSQAGMPMSMTSSRSNGGLNTGTLPKPPPPPRSFSNFSTLPHNNKGSVHQIFDELKV